MVLKKLNENDFINLFTLDFKRQYGLDGLSALYNHLNSLRKPLKIKNGVEVVARFPIYKSLEDYNIFNNTDYKSMEALSLDFKVIHVAKSEKMMIDEGV